MQVMQQTQRDLIIISGTPVNVRRLRTRSPFVTLARYRMDYIPYAVYNVDDTYIMIIEMI